MLLVVLLCLCLTPSLVAQPKLCPLGDTRGVANATCLEGATCAVFDGLQPKCTGWSRYRCAAKEYRNYKACDCLACPAGSGLNCTPDNECCSLEDCGKVPATTRPLALASAPRLAPLAAMHVALLLWLVLMLSKVHTHRV